MSLGAPEAVRGCSRDTAPETRPTANNYIVMQLFQNQDIGVPAGSLRKLFNRGTQRKGMAFRCNWCGKKAFLIECDICGNAFCGGQKPGSCWQKHKELHPKG